MADWNAAAYSRFETERTRPARDLVAQLPASGVGTVVDLGCGPGNSTELLEERYPEASILGLDSSPDMLAKARQRLPRVRFAAADIAGWRPGKPVDVIFSNATLQWLPDHAALFPRLLGAVASGGALAIQMPDNLDEPSHVAMRAVAADPRWRDRLAGAEAARTAIPPAARYVDWLSPLAASVDVWRTTYHHRLENPAAIVAWFRTSGLRPYVDPLPAAEQARFLALYEERVALAYPPLADGSVLLAFPRLFILARRKGP